MHDVRLDHDRANLVEIGKQQNQTRGGHDQAQDHHADPEPDLLARVESAGGNVLAGDHSSQVHEPFEIVEAREVVLDEHDDEHQQAHDEYGADEIVQVFRDLREPGEQRVADHGQQHVFSQHHDQATHAEDDEADRDDPVRVALERREPFDQPAGGRAVDLDTAAPLVERSDHDRDQGDQPSGDRRDPPVLQLAPRLPISLDQHA